MKKLSVFIYSMAGGGAERVVSNLLKYLVNHFEIHLILQNEQIDYTLPKGVKIHLLENSKPFESGILKLAKIPFLALKYKALCQNLGIDTHFVWMNRPCYIAGLARIFGLKGAFVFNECSTPSVLYKNAGIKGAVSKALLKWLYPKADFIYPNSSGALEDLRDNYGINPSKMRVLYNALDLDEIEQKAAQPLTELENKKFFLSVGRLDSGKNHELLIRAYASLGHPDLPDLVILGRGVLEAHLRGVINKLGLEQKVHLLGFNANPYKFMRACEAFVFVSRFEGFANVLIEAMACGALVITSEHKSGAKELIGDDKYGILVPVDDERATAAAMQRVLDEKTLKEQYHSRSLTRAKDFAAPKIASELIAQLKGF